MLDRGDRVIATGCQASERMAHLEDTGTIILDLDVTAPPKALDPGFIKRWEYI
jgi:hypothetical protein